MNSVRLTMAQALVRFLLAQRTVAGGRELPLVAGVFAIFGHGNVAGLGEALAAVRERLPTYRGQNEQSMAHAAVAFAKAMNRRQLMACTTSIGPGATNLVTAAAAAHVSRLPVLLLPGDVFASRASDPVLQQLEDFDEPSLTVNDCLRPVSRWFDRILRPEQLLASLPQAMAVLTDPAACGPVTLALPQDVQTEAYDFPESFFAPRLHAVRRLGPDLEELDRAVRTLAAARKPLVIAGGGVHYAGALPELERLAREHELPVAETQAGKGALPWDHPSQVGAIGVTGSAAANALARDADVVLAVGTRLSDFTTASRSLFQNPEVRFINLNVGRFDAHKHGGLPLVCDAHLGLAALCAALENWRPDPAWTARVRALATEWNQAVECITAPGTEGLPSDAQVLGAVNRACDPSATVVCAAGGLPGELHKLWRVREPGTYHVEYGYSCMGYEIAGGLGVKLARPDSDVVVLVGDGSYLMLNSEIVTSIITGKPLTIVLLDNHGFGCISRLQQATGGEPFNNALAGPGGEPPPIDFAAHAAALGATSKKVSSLAELEEAVRGARCAERTTVIVIDTDPERCTTEGGAWWEVAVPEVSMRDEVRRARRQYEEHKCLQRRGP